MNFKNMYGRGYYLSCSYFDRVAKISSIINYINNTKQFKQFYLISNVFMEVNNKLFFFNSNMSFDIYMSDTPIAHKLLNKIYKIFKVEW